MNSDLFAKSFFDATDPKSSFEFTRPSSQYKKDLHTPAIVKTSLTCKSLKSPKPKQGFYALHNQLLAYYGEESNTSPLKVLDLAQCRLRSLQSSRVRISFGFMLTKNSNSFEILSSDKQVIDSWKSALKKICILDKFSDYYKTIKMIGKGSFAKVYLVEEKRSGKQFAAKTFNKEQVISSNKTYAKAALINEIDIMKSLNHDNIIKLHEVHESDKCIFLIMELVTGKPLQDVLKKSTFLNDWSELRIMHMVRSMLDAIAYVTSKGLMHRDLKPANILVDKKGKIKIIDFGLATYINASDYIFKKCGTPGYIAPEVFKYDPKITSTSYDEKCDVFSIGCIFYYMLHGRPMLDGDDSSKILELNRVYNGFEVAYNMKKELSNVFSRLNKEGLNLILEMIQYDQKKRISASDALNHVYFKPIINKSVEVNSFKDLLPELKNFTLPDLSPTSSVRSENTNTNSNHHRSRFAEKSSLFLDLGRPEINGNIGTISNDSKVNSGVINGSTTPQSNSLSAFGKNHGLLSQRDKGQNRSLKGSRHFENQLVLKAAIFNNMQRASCNVGEESKREFLLSQIQPRRNSEAISREIDNDYQDSEGLSSDSIDSSELNDLGDENIHVQALCHQKRMSPKRKTKKLTRLIKQVSRSVSKL